jgi:hypothetical protein
MSSAEIKERIEHYFNCSNIPTSEKDWKRVHKFSSPHGNIRQFQNNKLNRTIYTIGDDEDCAIFELDQWVYGTWIDDDGSVAVSFEAKDRWNRTGYVYDQHQEWLLQTFFGLDPDEFEEVTENTFVAVNLPNVLAVHIFLKKLGFEHDQTLTDFLNDTSNGPAPGTPTPPVNPPLPPFLDPNFVPPNNSRMRSLPAPSLSSHAGTAQNIMAQIAQIAGNLGAGSVQVGGTNIPAAPGTPGAIAAGMRPIAVPKLPPSGIFNAPGMQAAMPLMAGQWPELADLQPAVQAAFISQRAAGLKGLDQVEPGWEDETTIKRRLRNGDWVTVERSQAIWVLYEICDDGNSMLEDYFAETDEFLHETLVDALGLDEDEFENLEIIDDEASYPAPYDLPVPQPAQFAPPPPPQRPGPMVGPASINARSGSFAPVSATPPAVAPVAPPVGNVSADIRHDSGDQWPEFCNEVWEFYEANKATLPLDINWSDRFRPREAQITGLGYKFERVEYTGIRVQMGYLGRDGELIETIDLPSVVLGELLKEWGGEWNVDDVTQFINKRKGEDPETGFSYSSQTLWEEVEPFLQGHGWKEAK